MTAIARYTIRSAARDGSPAEVLARLNDTLLHEDGRQQFVTVAMAYVTCSDGGATACLVLAGHPQPFVLRSDGTVEQVGKPGTLLGMSAEIPLHETVVELARGDTLLLYTDGIIEAGERSAPFGEEGLARVLASLAGSSPAGVVVAVEQAAIAADPGRRMRDDVALLALRATGADGPVAEPEPLELVAPAEPASLGRCGRRSGSWPRGSRAWTPTRCAWRSPRRAPTRSCTPTRAATPRARWSCAQSARPAASWWRCATMAAARGRGPTAPEWGSACR